MAKVSDILAANASSASSRVAMSDGVTELTHWELAAWVAGAAAALGNAPETVGIYGENSVEWAVAFLVASVAGKTIVPIPTFFSDAQCAHLIRDAGLERVIAVGSEGGGNRLPVPVLSLPRERQATFPAATTDGGMIIYTSGSTGTPKGVRLMSGQPLWTANALAAASGATDDDRYLSVLPLPMLLETICGILTPVLVGGSAHFDAEVAAATGAGKVSNIAGAFASTQPTMSVLVPQLLALYMTQLTLWKSKAPETLRFVAVGGAPVPAALNAAAAKMGLPVYEGYGLSECASVVALNRPGASRAGTVGQPLPGLNAQVEDGEIVVEGPSVMDGYLRGGDVPRRWRTGDMGAIDSDGFVTIFGRRDNLIITPYGRNVNPEWIETMLLGDPRIGGCALCLAGHPAQLVMLIVPSQHGAAWLGDASPEEVNGLVAGLCAAAPEYARPKSTIVTTREEASAHGLFTSNGKINRQQTTVYLHGKMSASAHPMTIEVRA
jgi:long-subunit acyl-CoA synthetase (AMP-forming)